jgi:uncharacterized protein
MDALTWIKPAGAEYVTVQTGAGRLRASGVAVGAQPLPYHLEYQLMCANDYVTGELTVRTSGAGWTRDLQLTRLSDGTWRADAQADGDVSLPPPGGDPDALTGALDCDLGLSPLTNTMPVLRHGLLSGGKPAQLLMAWVSVPDLSVHPAVQRYTFVRPTPDGGAVINYSSGDFSADITFDAVGLVVDYPGIGSRG